MASWGIRREGSASADFSVGAICISRRASCTSLPLRREIPDGCRSSASRNFGLAALVR